MTTNHLQPPSLPELQFRRFWTNYANIRVREERRDTLYALHRALLANGMYEGAAMVGGSVVRLCHEIEDIAREKGLL